MLPWSRPLACADATLCLVVSKAAESAAHSHVTSPALQTVGGWVGMVLGSGACFSWFAMQSAGEQFTGGLRLEQAFHVPQKPACG